MEINFENLAKINDILIKLDNLEQKVSSGKRWLNINETAHYLGYSKDHIHKMKNDSFVLGIHYHKKSGKLLFDKIELDNWVTFDTNAVDARDIASEVLKDLL
ncbi:MAG: helix-turn-helix domain-containing protein [Campylobacterota bacterium]|nr:helix-turn-helix domain-containing protein [Campylobacterota bacterium]